MDHSDSDSRKRVDGRSSSREWGGLRVVSHRIDLLVPSCPSLHDATLASTVLRARVGHRGSGLFLSLAHNNTTNRGGSSCPWT
ncbi:hypothetical protein ABZ488_36000 [Streptomyces griseus]|uniref:hypothetical protein n=1 Tax=Streptomyces griseus TaxID=1911 RepID=UPI0033C926BD